MTTKYINSVLFPPMSSSTYIRPQYKVTLSTATAYFGLVNYLDTRQYFQLGSY